MRQTVTSSTNDVSDVAVVYGTAEETSDDVWLQPVSERKFGVEMECITDLGALIAACRRLGVTLAREGYNHNDHHDGVTWKAVSDGSLRYTGSRPGFATVEIVSPVMSGTAGLRQLKLMTKAMAEVGTIVNQTCGLHVHQDAHDLTVLNAVRLAHNYNNAQRAIDKLVAPSRRGSQTYCGPFDSSELRLMESATSINGFPTHRYRSVNIGPAYRAHRSVEFRQHHGTVDFKKVAAWVSFTASMVEKAKAGVMVETNTQGLQIVFDKMQMPSNINLYLLGRAKELKTISDAEYNSVLGVLSARESGTPAPVEVPAADPIEDIPEIFSRDAFGRIIPTPASRAI